MTIAVYSETGAVAVAEIAPRRALRLAGELIAAAVRRL